MKDYPEKAEDANRILRQSCDDYARARPDGPRFVAAMVSAMRARNSDQITHAQDKLWRLGYDIFFASQLNRGEVSHGN